MTLTVHQLIQMTEGSIRNARYVPCNIATGVNTCVNAKLMLQCVAMIATHCNGALVAMVPFLDAFATLQSVAIPCLDVSCNVAIGGEGPDSGVNGWRCNVATMPCASWRAYVQCTENSCARVPMRACAFVQDNNDGLKKTSEKYGAATRY